MQTTPGVITYVFDNCTLFSHFGVTRALNDRRMDMREASERARNRNEWRMIVTQF